MEEEQFDHIEFDFGVKLLSKVDKESLYAKKNGLLIHFVFKSHNGSFKIIDQAYVHRHELAKSVVKFQETEKSDSSSISLSGGLTMVISRNDNDLQIDIQWINSDTSFSLTNQQNEVYTSVLKDVKTVNGIHEKSQNDKNFGFDLLQKTVGGERDIKNEGIKNLGIEDCEIMAFEATEKQKYDYSISKVYKDVLNSDLGDIDTLSDLLLENFEYVYSSTHCDCGDEGCFFDILKANQLAYFPGNYLEKGTVNSDLVAENFADLWKQLDFRAKAVLVYLNGEFYNSTLLNLAFLRPEFNLNNYQFLMTYPYQPDSEQDEDVRSITTIAQYFLRMPHNGQKRGS